MPVPLALEDYSKRHAYFYFLVSFVAPIQRSWLRSSEGRVKLGIRGEREVGISIGMKDI